MRLRDISFGNPAFAENTALLALCPTSLQTFVKTYVLPILRIESFNLVTPKLTFLSSVVEEL